MAATRQLPALSLEAAKVAADAAEQKAKQMGMGEYLIRGKDTVKHRS